MIWIAAGLCSLAQAGPPAQPTSRAPLTVQVKAGDAPAGQATLAIADGAEATLVAGARTWDLTVFLNPEDFLAQVPIAEGQTAVCVLVSEVVSTEATAPAQPRRPCLIVGKDQDGSTLSWATEGLTFKIDHKPQD